MSIPVWVLLGFAGWTLLVLFSTVGVYRWSRILTGRATVAEWSPDDFRDSDWYRRAIRAHMNCLENLPVYTAIVVVLMATGISSPVLDALAIAMLAARICQTLIHVSLVQTNIVASLRFTFYFIQILCMAAMGILTAVIAGG